LPHIHVRCHSHGPGALDLTLLSVVQRILVACWHGGFDLYLNGMLHRGVIQKIATFNRC